MCEVVTVTAAAEAVIQLAAIKVAAAEALVAEAAVVVAAAEAVAQFAATKQQQQQ